MKIYSITEIVQATNNLYKRANNNDIKNEDPKNTINENEPLILSKPIDEPEIKQKENIELPKKIKSTKKKEIINVNNLSTEEIKKNKKKDEIVDELFNILKKKNKKKYN